MMKIRLVFLLLLALMFATLQPAMAKGAEPCAEDATPLTYAQMVEAAVVQVPGISVAEAYYRMKFDSNTLLVDVSEVADSPIRGRIVGGVSISLGALPLRADLESPTDLRYVGLQDRSRPIITTGQGSPNGARAAKLLNDMGFSNVVYVEGGMEAWTAAGQPTHLSAEVSLPLGKISFRPGEY